jgi:hypothetical protein
MLSMPLYNKLDDKIWIKGNYTATAGNGLTGTIYSEPKLVNVFDGTNYTAKIYFYDQNRIIVQYDDITWVSASGGTWVYLPTLGEMNFDFIGEIEIQLTKTDDTEELTAIGMNGSSKLRIR